MKILIYGMGVIGSLYATLLSNAGFKVYGLARGNRLAVLKEKGLLYRVGEVIKKANVQIVEKLNDGDKYDYIFLPVRSEQLKQALRDLRENVSPNIVMMTNTIERYEDLEAFCGHGRLIPAFPGAGGSIDEGVLNASLTPAIIQPTTFGEINGQMSGRIKTLAAIFKRCSIPYQIVPDMHAWQVSHLGLVVPIADAYYMTKTPENAGADTKVMTKTAKRLKANFKLLSHKKMLSPFKMNLIMMMPTPGLSRCLSAVFDSDFGRKFMYEHAVNAPQEMRQLHNDFYGYAAGLIRQCRTISNERQEKC